MMPLIWVPDCMSRATLGCPTQALIACAYAAAAYERHPGVHTADIPHTHRTSQGAWAVYAREEGPERLIECVNRMRAAAVGFR